MLALILFCLIAGVSLSSIARNRPTQQLMVEGSAGSLVILGLALIGCCLPLFR